MCMLIVIMLTVPSDTPAGIGTFSRTPTIELLLDLSDVPLLSLQDCDSLFPVVRLLDERLCQEAGQTQRLGY